jgi:hypothetical protein
VWRRVVLVAIAASLCGGCETERSGLDYSATLQKVGPPRAGQARVVVLREKGYGGIADAAWNVQLDGTPLSSLKTGTYAYLDRPAGHHQLTASEAGFPGATQQDLALQPGQTYFFVARYSKRKSAFAATASTGLLGLAITTAVTSAYDNPGPLDFFPLEDGAAKVTIAELRLAE